MTHIGTQSAMERQMDEPLTHFRLRLPNDLKGQIEAMAQEEQRSQNGQIVYLLKQALRSPRQSEGASA